MLADGGKRAGTHPVRTHRAAEDVPSGTSRRPLAVREQRGDEAMPMGSCGLRLYFSANLGLPVMASIGRKLRLHRNI